MLNHKEEDVKKFNIYKHNINLINIEYGNHNKIQNKKQTDIIWNKKNVYSKNSFFNLSNKNISIEWLKILVKSFDFENGEVFLLFTNCYLHNIFIFTILLEIWKKCILINSNPSNMKIWNFIENFSILLNFDKVF